MIIQDLDFLGPLIAPPEYDPPLIVYSDRMLASEVPSQSFQSVARRRHKITEHCGVVQLHQFSAGDPGDVRRKALRNAEAREKDYLIWDDELPGFGLRVFSSGKRSYVIQYRTRGRSRRYTIGLHGAWAPETARREAKVQLGRVAGGDDPIEDRQLDHKAITVKELCTRYLADLRAGLILGKGGRPKKRRQSPPTLAVLSVTSFRS